MAHRVEFTPAAARDLRKLPRDVQRRIGAQIKKLGSDPRPRGCTKLDGENDIYRIRAGDYRILYQVEDKALLVLIVRIRHRREVYRTSAA